VVEGMKINITILLILVFTACAFGQAKKNTSPRDYVHVEISEDGATAELLPMPVGMSTNLSYAEIGIKYFGVKSDADISFILILQGTKNRYSANKTFGVKLFSGDIPLSKNKLRLIGSVDKEAGKETLHFHITAEELAWLAGASSVKIEIYDSDTEQRHDTLSVTQTGLTQFKKFARGVLLIRSFFN
jgi:hypothetical protein